MTQLASEAWPLSRLRPNPLNPRAELQSAGLDELAASIRAQGCCNRCSSRP